MLFQVGDIVKRVDGMHPNRSKKRYVIIRIATDGSGWIYARPLGGSNQTITFPSQFMIKKVA